MNFDAKTDDYMYNNDVTMSNIDVMSKNDDVNDGVNKNVSDDDGDKPQWYFLTLSIIPVWILCGNCLVLLAVARQPSLRTLSNWVIVSLSFTDLLLALFVVPLGVYQLVSYLFSSASRWSLFSARVQQMSIFSNCQLVSIFS